MYNLVCNMGTCAEKKDSTGFQRHIQGHTAIMLYYTYQFTVATFHVRREPLPRHVSHLIKPRDPQFTQGIFPLPLHFKHLQYQIKKYSEPMIYNVATTN